MKNLSNQFGNKKILKSQKTTLVQNVFTTVSNKYDLMNDLMSLGTHRLWKKELIELINVQNNQKIIDVGSGTGDIGLKISSLNTSAKIFLGDLNLSMINAGKKKLGANDNKIKWINMNCEELPFADNFFDKYIISFCLRNVTDLKKTLNESFRVLKEGGEFFCLEFSTVDNPILNYVYSSYKNKLIPILGKFVTNNKGAYKYLSESIENFPNQKILSNKLTNSGFSNVTFNNLFGGIVCMHRGWKI